MVKITVSKTVDKGSIPLAPAKYQSVEQFGRIRSPWTREIVGSNPTALTIIKLALQLNGRALARRARRSEFDSRRGHQTNKGLQFAKVDETVCKTVIIMI